jgi:predicted ATPase
MIYLESITFPSADQENNFFYGIQRTVYDSYHPFQVLSAHHFTRADFEPVTVFYGNNGSGKTTALNVIAEKAELARDSAFNKSNFFTDYVKMCRLTYRELPERGRIVTSDDVFDYMLNVRSINEGIDRKREELFEDYLDAKFSKFQMKTIADYERLKKMNKARSKTQSKYVRGELMDNTKERSNGENAYKYFIEKIGENGLYLLDEPENSLSPLRQRELAGFIGDSARYFNCQFIISTHSPFLLAMEGAKIYDLDADPVDVKEWTQLENVRVYFDFFSKAGL